MTKRLEQQLHKKTGKELIELLARCQHEGFRIRDQYNRLVNEIHTIKQTARSGEELHEGILVIIKAFEPWE